MNTFIEKNRKLLKFYYAAIRLSGWVLLTLGSGMYVIFLLITRNLGLSGLDSTSLNTSLKSLEFILFGLLGLGIAQLIRYLTYPDFKSGFILRHGSKFLYAYVVLSFVMYVIRYLVAIQSISNSDTSNKLTFYFIGSLDSLILFAAKALVLIAAAQFLKRIMPVIEEHKSLV